MDIVAYMLILTKQSFAKVYMRQCLPESTGNEYFKIGGLNVDCSNLYKTTKRNYMI